MNQQLNKREIYHIVYQSKGIFFINFSCQISLRHLLRAKSYFKISWKFSIRPTVREIVSIVLCPRNFARAQRIKKTNVFYHWKVEPHRLTRCDLLTLEEEKKKKKEKKRRKEKKEKADEVLSPIVEFHGMLAESALWKCKFAEESRVGWVFRCFSSERRARNCVKELAVSSVSTLF